MASIDKLKTRIERLEQATGATTSPEDIAVRAKWARAFGVDVEGLGKVGPGAKPWAKVGLGDWLEEGQRVAP